jgi:CDP-diacylglycerol--serine O-phosphatidyltransferase
MKITRAFVPSLFTVLNMFCGFLCIVHASNGEFITASWFILLAAGFDAFDGIMARITKSSSQFGVEIDSLSDVVSFGAAPAFLVYQMSLNHMGGAGILISSLLMVFAGLRLARFNAQLVGFDKDHFVGLPVPVSAITIATFTQVFWSDVHGLDAAAATVLPWMAVALSLLMISKVKYDTLPRVSRRAINREPWKFVFLILAVVVIFATGGGAAFPLILLFISLGIIRYIGSTIKQILHHHRKVEEEESAEPSQIDV